MTLDNTKYHKQISVGILNASKIKFELDNNYILDFNNKLYSGKLEIQCIENELFLENEKINTKTIEFSPKNYENSFFTLKNVEIGINFHWSRHESQSFKGNLKFLNHNGKIWAINQLDIEDYLKSVISSEMNANCNIELLKAHTVISRSWLLYQLENKYKNIQEEKINTTTKRINWFDKDDHKLFDICADDHCQRYQGITKQTNKNVIEAVNLTKAEVLCYNNLICDARYAKCCGGITEKYSAAWENIDYDYLQSFSDNKDSDKQKIKTEEDWQNWIKSDFNCFCNTTDKHILSQILNDYDRETQDFFRWEQTYSQEELSELLKTNLEMDFGEIIDLEIIKRGESGRIIELKIRGSKQNFTIGKELVIRKALSKSHLYSSCFFVEKTYTINQLPSEFRIIGAGWGHGVGLCQIGAAVMADKNYNYQQILAHYYKNAEIKKFFKQ